MSMGKIKEDVFNVARFMLNSGKDIKAIMDVTGLSETSINRISLAETYAEFDEQRKVRNAKIYSAKAQEINEEPPIQISVDDLIPDDPITRLCEALNRQTNAIEKLLKMMSEIVNENALRGA